MFSPSFLSAITDKTIDAPSWYPWEYCSFPDDTSWVASVTLTEQIGCCNPFSCAHASQFYEAQSKKHENIYQRFVVSMCIMLIITACGFLTMHIPWKINKSIEWKGEHRIWYYSLKTIIISTYHRHNIICKYCIRLMLLVYFIVQRYIKLYFIYSDNNNNKYAATTKSTRQVCYSSLYIIVSFWRNWNTS